MISEISLRFPQAHILGIDGSEEMLSKAPKLPNVSYQRAHMETFCADPDSFDLIFSNAALHWLPDLPFFLPKLVSFLKPAGVLAFQIPDTRVQPSHVLMETAARTLDLPLHFVKPDALIVPEGKTGVRIPRCEYDPAVFYSVLKPLSSYLRIWFTEYIHEMSGEEPIFNFVRTTGLMPVVEAVPVESKDAFIEEYRKLVKEAYPPLEKGTTLFPLRRFFVIVQKFVECE